MEEFTDKLFTDSLGTLSTFAVSIGVELGWYDALASTDSMNPAELAAATSTDTRDAQEWLEQQTVSGSTFERYATEAGFSGVDVLPIDDDFFRFYRLAQ